MDILITELEWRHIRDLETHCGDTDGMIGFSMYLPCKWKLLGFFLRRNVEVADFRFGKLRPFLVESLSRALRRLT